MSRKVHRARLVEASDVSELIILAREHHAASRYHRLPFIGSRVAHLAKVCMSSPNHFGVVLETNSALSGYCAVGIEPYVFADKKLAKEIVLYVSPFARDKVALETLICEVEKHAVSRDVFTLDIGITSPKEDQDLWRYGKVFEPLGYKLHGISYWKDIVDG
jgi:hypothetical protein